jgi:hypothetical protein
MLLEAINPTAAKKKADQIIEELLDAEGGLLEA